MLTKAESTLVNVDWKEDWLPLFGALGSMTVTNVTIQLAKYYMVGSVLDFTMIASLQTNGTASDTITFTIPDTQIFTLPLSNAVDSPARISISEDDGVSWIAGVGRLQNTLIEIGKYDGSNFAITDPNPDIIISCSGRYEIAPPF